MSKPNFLLNEHLRITGELEESKQDLASNVPEVFKEISAVQTYTECSSKVGIAVSLIDGIIATSRILWMMDLSSKEVQEALKDLKDVYELEMLLTLKTESPQGRRHDEPWRSSDKT